MIGSRIANGLPAAATPTTTTTCTAPARTVRTTAPTVEQPDAHHVRWAGDRCPRRIAVPSTIGGPPAAAQEKRWKAAERFARGEKTEAAAVIGTLFPLRVG